MTSRIHIQISNERRASREKDIPCFEDACDWETRDETPENASLIALEAFLPVFARVVTTLDAVDLSEEVEEVEERLGVFCARFLVVSPSVDLEGAMRREDDKI